ncbi:MAG: sulfite exporter TauE/SafE family protein [Bacteroidetes bacterium]|nr:sulfite exporter TauE/SafE family protein [Bacteroidota bacterium]
MSWFEITALIVAGILVGIINTLAGGGSIISLPLLMFMGLPADIANGTNRIAILLQNVSSVGMFQHKKVLDLKKGLWLSLPAVVGSVAGAWIAVDVNKEVIEKSIAVVMLFMLFFILVKPQRWIKERKELIEKKVSFFQVVIFFFIGLYGGFIQVGVGYFLLAGLVLSAGYELVKANALKVFIVLFFTPFALVIFIINHQVNWSYGLILGIGSLIGGYLASKMAISWGANFVRWVIVITILLTAAHIFGWIDIQGAIQSVVKK